MVDKVECCEECKYRDVDSEQEPCESCFITTVTLKNFKPKDKEKEVK